MSTGSSILKEGLECSLFSAFSDGVVSINFGFIIGSGKVKPEFLHETFDRLNSRLNLGWTKEQKESISRQYPNIDTKTLKPKSWKIFLEEIIHLKELINKYMGSIKKN